MVAVVQAKIMPYIKPAAVPAKERDTLDAPNAFSVCEEGTMVVSMGVEADVEMEAIWIKASAMIEQDIKRRQCSNPVQLITSEQIYTGTYRCRVQKPTREAQRGKGGKVHRKGSCI
jgi:hypothetical protein